MTIPSLQIAMFCSGKVLNQSTFFNHKHWGQWNKCLATPSFYFFHLHNTQAPPHSTLQSCTSEQQNIGSDNGSRVKKVVQQILSKLGNHVNIPIEVLKCFLQTRAFIQVRYINKITKIRDLQRISKLTMWKVWSSHIGSLMQTYKHSKVQRFNCTVQPSQSLMKLNLVLF